MDSGDLRIDFVAEYVLKTFKLKPDKWSKLINNEENKQMLMEFFEKQDNSQLIITLNNAGALLPSFSFPSTSKNKSVYFLKKDKREAIGKDNFKTALVYGDISAAPLEQLSALVDEVSIWTMITLADYFAIPRHDRASINLCNYHQFNMKVLVFANEHANLM